MVTIPGRSQACCLILPSFFSKDFSLRNATRYHDNSKIYKKYTYKQQSVCPMIPWQTFYVIQFWTTSTHNKLHCSLGSVLHSSTFKAPMHGARKWHPLHNSLFFTRFVTLESSGSSNFATHLEW